MWGSDPVVDVGLIFLSCIPRQLTTSEEHVWPFLTVMLMSYEDKRFHLETHKSNNWFSSPPPKPESHRGEPRFIETIAGQNLGFLCPPKPNKKYRGNAWRK